MKICGQFKTTSSNDSTYILNTTDAQQRHCDIQKEIIWWNTTKIITIMLLVTTILSLALLGNDAALAATAKPSATTPSRSSSSSSSTAEHYNRQPSWGSWYVCVYFVVHYIWIVYVLLCWYLKTKQC